MSARRPLLLPLVPLYAAGLLAKQRMAARQWPRPLRGVVVSVGSVSAGGAGKTPVVLALARLLRMRGYAVDVLTRGYGRGGRTVERVDPDGDALRFGDEPLLLARRAAVPVYVGADRVAAGLLAEADADGQAGAAGAGDVGAAARVHLLDDGFQHRRLARDLDAVLLTREDVADSLLPAGNLREPLSALRAADVVVVREEEAEALERFLTVLLREREAPPVWRIARSLTVRRVAAGGAAPARPMVFCGIARPEGFLAMLRSAGVVPGGTALLPDHHRYGDRTVTRLVAEARRAGADGFVTTEKDAVKLGPETRSRLQAVGPLAIAELEVRLVEERSATEQLIGLVPRLNRRRRPRA